jgi:hypothetical protein
MLKHDLDLAGIMFQHSELQVRRTSSVQELDSIAAGMTGKKSQVLHAKRPSSCSRVSWVQSFGTGQTR